MGRPFMPRRYGRIEDVDEMISLPDGAALELSATEDGYVAAIICRKSDGSTGWKALPPGGEADTWTSVRLDGDVVIANSWSCWRVHLNPVTGAETGRHFTK